MWLWVLGVCVGIGLWEITTGHHLSTSGLVHYVNPYPWSSYYERIRYFPTAVFYNTNDFAAFLSLCVPFLIVWIKYNQRLRDRVLGVGLLLASLFVLLHTESRSSYLAISLGLIFWVVVLLKTRGKIVVAVTAILMIVALLIAEPSQVTRLYNSVVGQFGGLGLANASVAVRWLLILNALRSVVITFGFGLGAGNVEIYLKNYARYNLYYTGGVTNLHNWWLEILADYGILIFIGIILFYLRIILNLYKVFRETEIKEQRMLAEALLPGLVGFSIAAVSTSSLFGVNQMWMYFGFALAVINLHRITQRHKLACTS
jgi:teichuronic acid biosynthesis protein TuaE